MTIGAYKLCIEIERGWEGSDRDREEGERAF